MTPLLTNAPTAAPSSGGNALIAALRAGSAPAGAMPTGVKNLSFSWQKNSPGGALVMPPPKAPPVAPPVTPPLPPPPAPPPPPPPRPPKTEQDFRNNNFTYEDLTGIGNDNWDRKTGENPNPTAIVIDANKDRVQNVNTANPVLNLVQKDPTIAPPSPVATIGMDEMGDKFGMNVGDSSGLPIVDIPNPYANPIPFEFDMGADNGGVPSDGVQVVPTPAAPGPVAAAAPATDEVSVRQTLEQILADKNPQVVVPPAAEPMPENVDIPAFDSGINFEMPETLFRTPAPFVPGFTPDADVAAAMQAPPPVVQEAPEIDPELLAMLNMPQQPAPVQATQPVPEEPMYDMQLPNWYFDAFGMGSTR